MLASSAANLHVLRQNTICIAGVLGAADRRWKGNILNEKRERKRERERKLRRLFGLEVATVPQVRAVILQFKSVGREIGTHICVDGVEGASSNSHFHGSARGNMRLHVNAYVKRKDCHWLPIHRVGRAHIRYITIISYQNLFVRFHSLSLYSSDIE